MARIDWSNPDPERGIFGCSHPAQQYGRARDTLPEIDSSLLALSKTVDDLLRKATGAYYTSRGGPSWPFRHSAEISIRHLEQINHKLTKFVTDIRENFLREAAAVPFSFFLSYSRNDEQFAVRFARDLRSRGHIVWRDDDDIMIGESVRRSIEKGIGGSRFVVALVSNSSIKSEWCQKELDMALTKETTTSTKVLPIVIDDCEIPLVLQGKRYLVIKNYERDFQKFLSQIPTG